MRLVDRHSHAFAEPDRVIPEFLCRAREVSGLRAYRQGKLNANMHNADKRSRSDRRRRKW